jgi:hypothetical protein
MAFCDSYDQTKTLSLFRLFPLVGSPLPDSTGIGHPGGLPPPEVLSRRRVPLGGAPAPGFCVIMRGLLTPEIL